MINSDAVKIKALAKVNQYLVTLKHAKPEMLYFANRPQRSATYMDSNQFLKNWHSYFGHTPPNAGLVHVGLAAHTSDYINPNGLARIVGSLRRLCLKVIILKQVSLVLVHFLLIGVGAVVIPVVVLNIEILLRCKLIKYG